MKVYECMFSLIKIKSQALSARMWECLFRSLKRIERLQYSFQYTFFNSFSYFHTLIDILENLEL